MSIPQPLTIAFVLSGKKFAAGKHAGATLLLKVSGFASFTITISFVALFALYLSSPVVQIKLEIAIV